jgi:hypothetical protein
VRAGVGRAGALVREHWLISVLVGVGAVLRLLALLAYRPALMSPDSLVYLANSRDLHPDLLRPLGYPLFLWALPLHHDLALIPALQHAMGLGIGLLIYVLMLRFGLPRWGAALAAAPALLDAYLIDIEEFVLSETLFHLLLVAAIAALLWRRRPSVRLAALSGLLLAGVTVTRANGEVAIVAVLAALLLLRPGWRPAAALVAACAIPLIGYLVWFHSTNGFYGITGYSGRFLYARVAPFADCSKFSVPAKERVLCPTQPVGKRPRLDGSSVEFYMWDGRSPVWRIPTPTERRKLTSSFARRVILHQPVTYARTVLHDFLRSFTPIRTRHDGELPIGRWQFQTHYPYVSVAATAEFRKNGGTHGKVKPGVARVLRAYQRFGFVPGPLYALGLVLSALAALGVGRARRSGLRTATLLFGATAVLVFGATVAANQFSWRYQLSQNVLIPPAAALAVAALLRRRYSNSHEAVVGSDGLDATDSYGSATTDTGIPSNEATGAALRQRHGRLY